MLERATVLAELGVVHGFTTRQGGVSQGPFSTLNMGGKWGDDPEAVAENRRRVGAAAGFDPGEIRLARQVHGAQVVSVADLTPDTEADAVVCVPDDGAAVAAVLTADCVPVLLADRRGRAVAAVHSGWRGTVAGVVRNAVATLRRLGVTPGDVVAAIGPCIELAAFEVGPEVAAQFDDAFVDATHYDKPHIDLVACIRRQLEAAGVPANSIERVGTCTHANPDRYFSFRRDGRGIGQMMSLVGLGRR